MVGSPARFIKTDEKAAFSSIPSGYFYAYPGFYGYDESFMSDIFTEAYGPATIASFICDTGYSSTVEATAARDNAAGRRTVCQI